MVHDEQIIAQVRDKLTSVLRLRDEARLVAAARSEVTPLVGVEEPDVRAHVQRERSQHLAHGQDTLLVFDRRPFGGGALELLHLLGALVDE